MRAKAEEPSNSSEEKRKSKEPSTLRLGRRYRANRVDEKYDTIIIGSGTSALAAASCLAKMGQKVAVLEQHYTVGGLTHSYSRNGFEWDVGVHYLNDVSTNGTIFKKLFDFISNNQLEWHNVEGDKYQIDFNDDRPMMFSLRNKEDRKRLANYFPGHRQQIDAIFDHAKRTLLRSLPAILLMKFSGPGKIGQAVASFASQHLLPKDASRSVYEVTKRFIDNERLAMSFASLWWTVFGITPEKLSFFYMCLYLSNNNPLAYPVGGSSSIAKSVIPVVQSSGGEIFSYANVEEIIVRDGRAIGVRMADGLEILADATVSTIGIHSTFYKLLPASVSQRKYYIENMEQLAPSTGHFNLFVGFNGSNEELGLNGIEYIAMNSENIERDNKLFSEDLNNNIPTCFITFPSSKDSDWDKHYPGKSTASVIVYIDNFDLFKPWQDTQWENRGEDYERMKEEISQRILAVMFKRHPQLKDRVSYYELSTPLSMEYFTKKSKGAMFGFAHDEKRLKQTWMQAKTTIPGLYLSGQDILAVGHTPSALSGALTAAQVLGMKKGISLIKNILTP